MKRKFDDVDDAINVLRNGGIIILVDAEEREDEGDFVAAADCIEPETIHFMTAQGRGQLCMPIECDIAQRLELRPIVASDDPGSPQFAVPVDHRSCKTGISPLERSITIRAMLDPSTSSVDFVRPGHVFPLISRAGGVLNRPGHTEASIDLMKMADVTPAALLCEICSDDRRHMASGDELFSLADRFQLPIVAIDQVIELQRKKQSQLQLVAEIVDRQTEALDGKLLPSTH